MGESFEKPDKVEYKYCSNCGRDTEHNIYIKKKYVTKTITHEDYYQHTETVSQSFTTTKQVCNVCGKTKKKTEQHCCQIF